MQFRTLALLALVPACAAAVHDQKGVALNGIASNVVVRGAAKAKGAIRGKVIQASHHDVEACTARAERFIQEPVDKHTAIEKAKHYCERRNDIKDREVICPDLVDFLEDALEEHDEHEELSAEKFCEATEAHLLDLHGIARVPNVAAGSPGKYRVSEQCEHTLQEHLEPAHEIKSSQAADFWYSICVSQDCAHFLPSRNRWCEVDRAPTHSIKICEGIRQFTHDYVEVEDSAAPEELSAAQLCGLYGDFAREANFDVQAYDRVMHEKVVIRGADHPHAVGVHSGAVSGRAALLTWAAAAAAAVMGW